MASAIIRTTTDGLTVATDGTTITSDGTTGALGVPAGGLGTSNLAAGSVTGVKLDNSCIRAIVFTGHNGAGACTATGLKVGDKVVGIAGLTTPADNRASFESTITVADQIQQSSASDFSAKLFNLIVIAKS